MLERTAGANGFAALTLDSSGCDVRLSLTQAGCADDLTTVSGETYRAAPAATTTQSTRPLSGRCSLRWKGPTVRSDELSGRLGVELVVRWGGDTLCVTHFAAPSAVFVGEASECDVALPAELLGSERRCVALSSRDDVCAVLPESVQGWLTLPDGSTHRFDERAVHADGTEAERLLPLPVGHRAHLCFASVEVQVAAVRLGPPCRRALGIDAALVAAVGLSVFTVASLLAVLSGLAPTPGLNQDERAEAARVRLLHNYLEAADEREAEPQTWRRDQLSRPAPSKPLTGRTAVRRPASRGAAPDDAEREDAEPEASPIAPAYELQDMTTPAGDPIVRRRQVAAARKFGIVGMLDWPELNDPSNKFERHMSGGELALMESLFNPDSPRYEGPGGLDLGVGIGGGGKADVVELGAVRTAAEGQGSRLARPGAATLELDEARPRPLPVGQGESIVSDPLAAASIRRVVDAERAALRDCYRNAQSTAAISATVRFVVLGNGQVEQVSASHPALPANVRACIERVFSSLSVPNPVLRPVHVAYRVALDS